MKKQIDLSIIMPRPLGGSIKRWWCLTSDVCLTSVCLSVAYIWPKSRTERPKKTKIGTEIAHITRDSDTTFKVKRSKIKVTGSRAYCGGLPHSLLQLLIKRRMNRRCVFDLSCKVTKILGCWSGFKNLGFKLFTKKSLKIVFFQNSTVRILVFKVFFTYCVTNSIKMTFKYELGFVAFTWPNLCLLDLSLLFTFVLVGRNFMSGICKLKPKKLFFLLKT